MKIRASATALAALCLLLTGCETKKTEPKTTGPTLKLTSPAPGTQVKGNVVSLALQTSIQIVKADGDTSGTTGHFHVFIDRDPLPAGSVIPREAGIVHAAKNPVELTGLSVGEHRLSVVLGDGAHTRLGDAVARTTVKVLGPSIDASAPATGKAGSPVTVTVKAEGVTLVKADGDTSGRTGHLHLFIDREPSPAGQPIPTDPTIIHSAATSIPVPGLAAGEHTITVVLGDGAHVPFADPVRDTVTFTLT